MRRVVIESPFAGDVIRNVEYARKAMFDAITRGEAPFASHLLYTQVLNDEAPAERERGLRANIAWIDKADALAVYEDYGISTGMSFAIGYAQARNIPIEYRKIL